MKTLLTLMFLPIAGLTSCALVGIPDYVGYKIINDVPYYSWGDGVAGDKFTPVPSADTKTFKALSIDYAKDKNHVYVGTRIVRKADPNTFEVLKYSHAKDKNHFYWWGGIRKGVDPRTAVILRKNLFMDKSSVYYFHEYVNPDKQAKVYYIQRWETIKSSSHLRNASGKQRYVNLVQRERAKRGWTLLTN